jgi:hypothetical protein
LKTILSIIYDLDRLFVGPFETEAESREWARQNLDPTVNPYLVADIVDPKNQKSLKPKPEEKSKILKEEKKETKP